MAKTISKKKKTTQEILDGLFARKMKLLNKLSVTLKKYNDLARAVPSADDWLFGMPIESVAQLRETKRPRRTRLGDLKDRNALKQKSASMETELLELEEKIKSTKVILLQEQINRVLDSSPKAV